MKSPMRTLAMVLITALAAVLLWNYLAVFQPVAKQLGQDARNEKVTLWTYYRYGVSPGVLVVDLWGVENEAAPMDIMRTVLQSAYALRVRSFDRVILSFRGKAKFMLKGKYFHALGRDYKDQNPVYTLRTFPENVYLLDGQQAYGTWTGGILGVLAKQMEDLNRFSRDWYIDELAADTR